MNASYRRMFTLENGSYGGQATYFHDRFHYGFEPLVQQLRVSMPALNYKLTKSLNATAQYYFVHQTQSNTFLIGAWHLQ